MNKKIKRRTDCVGIIPNDDVAIRLIGAVLIHWDEDWMDSRPYSGQESINLLHGEAN
ncbi:transposase [Candidatus Paracaedibacter acanthamoebae]|uniref:transposase n=1 Tax=Candidatus Odyssella acanthamoebae TaxID=91604 RepID=UPI0018DB050A